MQTPDRSTDAKNEPLHRDMPIPDAQHPMAEVPDRGFGIEGWTTRDAIGSVTPQTDSTTDRKRG